MTNEPNPLSPARMYRRRISDPVELDVAEGLTKAGIRFIHESQRPEQRLDFFLPQFDVYIECKAFHADRTGKQIEGKQVIVIQGRKAAAAFAAMLAKRMEGA